MTVGPIKVLDVHVKENSLYAWDAKGEMHTIGLFDDDRKAWEEVLEPTNYVTSPYTFSIGCRLKAMSALAPFDLSEVVIAMSGINGLKTVRIEWAQVEVDVVAAKFVVAAYRGDGSMDPDAERYVLKEHNTREEAEATFRYYFHGIGEDKPTFPRWVKIWDLSSELLR